MAEELREFEVLTWLLMFQGGLAYDGVRSGGCVRRAPRECRHCA